MFYLQKGKCKFYNMENKKKDYKFYNYNERKKITLNFYNIRIMSTDKILIKCHNILKIQILKEI